MRASFTRLAVTISLGLAMMASAAQAQEGFDRAFDSMDANNDGVLSRAEFLASRHSRFLALDRNHDGYLTEADMPQLIALVPGEAERASAMLTRFDANHDGRVSEEEFVRDSSALFDRADTNHDGQLTRAEAAAMAERIRAPRGRP